MLPPPTGLRAEPGGGAGDAALGPRAGRRRLPGAARVRRPACGPSTTPAATSWRSRTGRTRTRPARRASATGTRSRPSRTCRVTGPAGPEVVAASLAGAPPSRCGCPSTSDADHRRAAAALAADDRLRAPEPAAQRGLGRRAADRRRPDVRPARRPRRARGRRRSGPTPSSATTSASTARSTGEPVHDFTGVDAVYDRLLGLGLRPVVELSYMPRDLASDPSVTVFDYGGDRLAAARLGALGGARARPASSTSSTATASTRSATTGRSRCGTSRTSRCSGAARARSSGGCTTRRSAPSGGRPAARRRRTRRPPPPAGSTGCSTTSASSGAPVDFVSTHTYGNAAAGPAADAGALRPRRRPDLVDRVGRHAHALRQRQRRRLLGRVPGARDARRRPAGSTPCPTGSSPTSSRSSAVRRACCTAASGCARSASCASRAGGRCTCWSSWVATSVAATVSRATAPGRWSRRGRRGTATTGSPSRSGTAPSTRARWTGRRSLDRTVSLTLTGLRRGRVDRARVPRGRRRTPTSRPSGADLGAGADWPDEDQWAALRAADRLAVQEYPLDGSVVDRAAQPERRAGRGGAGGMSTGGRLVADRRRLPGLRPLVRGRATATASATCRPRSTGWTPSRGSASTPSGSRRSTRPRRPTTGTTSPTRATSTRCSGTWTRSTGWSRRRTRAG